jgi:hypothetical protein
VLSEQRHDWDMSASVHVKLLPTECRQVQVPIRRKFEPIVLDEADLSEWVNVLESQYQLSSENDEDDCVQIVFSGEAANETAYAWNYMTLHAPVLCHGPPFHAAVKAG